MSPLDPAALLPAVIAAARRAGAITLGYYQGGHAVARKLDGSPVTVADHEAEAAIVATLAEIAPGVPVVAEEAFAGGHEPEVGDHPFWLVDPLDGTKEFVSGNGDFTVNIALIVDRLPALGVVLAPAHRLLYAAAGPGTATHQSGESAAQAIRVRRPPPEGPVVVASRSHRDTALEAYIAKLSASRSVSRGSSLKFCLVAAGEADIYPRTGPTMEWDTAAGHAVLLGAGGRMTTLEGAPFLYAKPGFRNGPFVCHGAG